MSHGNSAVKNLPTMKETWVRSLGGEDALEDEMAACKTMDCSLPGSSIHGIFQTRVLKCVAISFYRGSSRLRDQTQVSHTVGRHYTI